MRRNKAVVQIITREPRPILPNLRSIGAASGFILHADNRKPKPQKARRNGVAPRCACDQLQRENAFVRYDQAQRERLARGMCF